MSGSVRLLLLVVTSLAAACAVAGESGRVVRVIDGDTLQVRLADGVETIRLLGVDTPEMGDRRRTVEHFAREATAFTRRAALDQLVTLERDPRADNRGNHGRLLRYVILPDGTDLNATILAAGFGHALTRYPFSRTGEFRDLETRARLAGRGLWSPEQILTVDAGGAGRLSGRVARVCDVVASTRYVPGVERRPTFLNLAQPYPDQLLTIVIWGAERERFGKPERRYAGRRICVSGRVELYRGKPRIEIGDPTQIAFED